MVFYGVQFCSQGIMGRFLFLARSKRGNFMPHVIKWKYGSKVCMRSQVAITNYKW